jgi:hypothetical protein
MVDHCANPACMKPLRYLREGKIYVFQAPSDDLRYRSGHRLQHHWLCGNCSATLTLERVGNENTRVIPKRFGTTTKIRMVPDDERKAS